MSTDATIQAADAAEARALCDTLSPRQREVLILTAKGYSAKELGQLVGLAQKTVDAYRCDAFNKLGVCSSLLAAVIAAKAGLV